MNNSCCDIGDAWDAVCRTMDNSGIKWRKCAPSAIDAMVLTLLDLIQKAQELERQKIGQCAGRI